MCNVSLHPPSCPCEDSRSRSSVEAAVRALVAMVRRGNVQIHGDEAGLAAWDHLDALLDGRALSLPRAAPDEGTRHGEAADALAPWYLADGSTVMLPAEEVATRRKIAARVLDAALRYVRAQDAFRRWALENPREEFAPAPMYEEDRAADNALAVAARAFEALGPVRAPASSPPEAPVRAGLCNAESPGVFVYPCCLPAGHEGPHDNCGEKWECAPSPSGAARRKCPACYEGGGIHRGGTGWDCKNEGAADETKGGATE